MKAFVCERYGPPETLRLIELEDPSPKDDEVLIQSHAASVTAGDCRVRALNMPAGFGMIGRLAVGFKGPRRPILGSELSGTVIAVGKAVSKFGVGEEVIVFTGAKLGCHAELKCVPETAGIVRKPQNLTFGEAATIFSGGSTALAFLKRANILTGERVAVVGASGSVGSAAVQLAKHFGAEVTGVCSAANAELVDSLGADHVVDYAKQDFTANAGTFDVILDTVGTSASFGRKMAALRKGGRLLLAMSSLSDLLKAPWASMGGKKVVAGPAAWRVEDLQLLAELAESGVYRPVIDRSFSFAEIPGAHRFVETGRKRGNVAIRMTG